MADISKELMEASASASKKYNIPQSVILGFAGLETSFGTAGAGKSSNNLFGIMDSDGTPKAYSSIEESVNDFASLVTGNKSSNQSKIYGQATANASTESEWVYAITGAGYNSVYPVGVYEEKVLSVINGLDNVEIIDTTVRPQQTKVTWWGQIVVVIGAILIIVGGVVFLYLSIENSGNNPISSGIDKIKKFAKSDPIKPKT